MGRAWFVAAQRRWRNGGYPAGAANKARLDFAVAAGRGFVLPNSGAVYAAVPELAVLWLIVAGLGTVALRGAAV